MQCVAAKRGLEQQADLPDTATEVLSDKDAEGANRPPDRDAERQVVSTEEPKPNLRVPVLRASPRAGQQPATQQPTAVGRTVAHSAPPANGDERFAPGFCLLALQRARARAAAGDAAAAAVLPLLAAAEGGWAAALDGMHVNSPEPWLRGDASARYARGGMEWVG